MRDEMRCIFLTGFGEMHFVARPPRLALFAITGILIIRGVDESFAGSPRSLSVEPSG
jgi:hypothetical protein